MSALKAGDSTVIQVNQDNIDHFLFLRLDQSQDETAQNDRAIFVRGVPIYWQEESVKNIFAHCGKIVSCVYVKKPGRPELSGYRVTFKQTEACKTALEMAFSNIHCCKPTETSREDLPELYRNYVSRSLNAGKVIADVDKFLTEFLEQQEQKEKMEQELSQPDDDGWVTVTRHSKMKMKGGRKDTLRKRNRLKKKNVEKELLKFYKFQEVEEKKQMAHIEQLNAEKASRLEMVHKRKFRPY